VWGTVYVASFVSASFASLDWAKYAAAEAIAIAKIMSTKEVSPRVTG
jgi:hypothetical protein